MKISIISKRTLMTLLTATVLSLSSACKDDQSWITDCGPCEGDTCDYMSSEVTMNEDVPPDPCSQPDADPVMCPWTFQGCINSQSYFTEGCTPDGHGVALNFIYNTKNIVVGGQKFSSGYDVKAVFDAAPVNAFVTELSVLNAMSASDLEKSLRASALWARLNSIHYASPSAEILSILDDADRLLIIGALNWNQVDTDLVVMNLNQINVWLKAEDDSRLNIMCIESK
jgi:hypothetical protein